MKKNIYILIIFLSIFIFSNVYAEDCKLYDGQSKILRDYTTNLRKTVSNISVSLISLESQKNKETGISKDIGYLGSRLTKAFNLIIDWSGYTSYFKFYVTYSLNSEYVPEVWRDYKSLENESNGIQNFLKKIINNGYGDINLTKDKVCLNVQNCNLSGNAVDIITQLYKNNEIMLDYYRLSILGEQGNFNNSFILVGDNELFKKEFNNFYNSNTTMNCSLGKDDSFYNRAFKQIKDISKFQESMSSGIAEWKKAIDLMNGNNEDIERSLLKKELSRQGLNTKASNAILANLDKYNKEGGYSASNNPFSNTIGYFTKSVSIQIDEFKNSISQAWNNNNGEKNNIPLGNIGSVKTDIEITNNVNDRLKKMYDTELVGIQQQEGSMDKYIGKIIELHETLSDANKMLENTVKIAEKVCNDQKTGEGVCTTN